MALAPIEGAGVIQYEEGLMQENLPLWMKILAFIPIDIQTK
jgi:hypothetical protein